MVPDWLEDALEAVTSLFDDYDDCIDEANYDDEDYEFWDWLEVPVACLL